MYLLDTNICIYLMTGRCKTVANRFKEMRPGDVGTTAITAAELRYGAIHSARPRQNLRTLALFLAPLPRFAFDDAAAAHFAKIKDDLVRAGRPISTMDMLIAATARSIDATLVTNNTREFSRIDSLQIENWVS
jgi:tRNA(fMet)-specific endonuclease VapC